MWKKVKNEEKIENPDISMIVRTGIGYIRIFDIQDINFNKEALLRDLRDLKK